MENTLEFDSCNKMISKPTISHALLPYMKLQRLIGRVPCGIKVSTDNRKKSVFVYYTSTISKRVLLSYLSGVTFMAAIFFGFLQGGTLGWQLISPNQM